LNFYNRFPGDYIKKTLDLTMVEDGAYTRLLDWMYANERAVPHEKRHTITRCQSAAERKAVDTVLAQYFTRDGDAWNHERTLEAIEEARPRIEAAKNNGKKGGRPRKTPPDITQQGEDKKPSGFSEGNPEGTQVESSPQPQPQPDSSLRSENTHRDYSTDGGRVCTPSGEVCRAMKAQGVADVSPDNQDLRLLLQAGAEVHEFVAAAQTAVGKRKGFAYALGIVRRSREDAASAKPLHKGPLPASTEPMNRQQAQLLGAAAMLGHLRPSTPIGMSDDPNTIDMEPIDAERHHIER
jgi:uncharacterized protein YdaU (DUF1376 family)